TALKNCEGRRAVKSWIRRLIWHLENVLKGQHPLTSVRIVAEAVSRLPATWAERQRVRTRRVRSDDEVVRFAFGEDTFFDPARYLPQYTLQNFAAMYRRKALVTGDPRHERIVTVAMEVGRSRLRYEPGFLTGRLLPLLEGE